VNPVRNVNFPVRNKFSNGVKITIRNLQKKLPLNPKRIKSAILKAISSQSRKESGELTICFVDDKKIKQLNQKYLHRHMPTDVLAFDLSGARDSKNIFADIIISTDTAVRNARTFKTNPLYEIYLYIVHGVLHILGYNDKNANQRKIMDKEAARILAQLKLAK